MIYVTEDFFYVFLDSYCDIPVRLVHLESGSKLGLLKYSFLDYIVDTLYMRNYFQALNTFKFYEFINHVFANQYFSLSIGQRLRNALYYEMQ